MDIGGNYRLPASRELVWAALNDPAVLKECIPGCRSLTRDGDAMLAEVVAQIGPVKATFRGTATIVAAEPPAHYVLSGEGAGGVAGFAKGSVDVLLAEDGADTLLTYQTKVQVGGKLAQLGTRLIDATARKLSAEFFDALSAHFAVEPAGPALDTDTNAAAIAGETAGVVAAPGAPGSRALPWIALAALVALAAGLWWGLR